MIYQSTQTYTVRKVDVMGVELNEVTNSIGMIVGLMSDEDFARQFKPV